jgi:siderophore synthetase component
MNSNAQNNVVEMNAAPTQERPATDEEVKEREQDLRENGVYMSELAQYVRHLADTAARYKGRELVSGPDGAHPLDALGKEKTAKAIECLRAAASHLGEYEASVSQYVETNKRSFIKRVFGRKTA